MGIFERKKKKAEEVKFLFNAVFYFEFLIFLIYFLFLFGISVEEFLYL